MCNRARQIRRDLQQKKQKRNRDLGRIVTILADADQLSGTNPLSVAKHVVLAAAMKSRTYG